jgi:thiamine biosynthesis protein ThiI
MYERILVRYGDLTLKGKNKRKFVAHVNKLIEEKIANKNVRYEKNHDRLYIVLNGENHEDIIAGLNKVSGLASYSLISKISKNIDEIKRKALEAVQSELSGKPTTFKVETKRADKDYPIKSPEITRQVAGYVLSHVDLLVVDVHKPDLTLNIEIRHHGAYVYCNKIKGMGGYPVGMAGKGLLLLSGGIDSPVAGYLAMKQGIEIEAIHFESTPLTSIESVQKVLDLTNQISVFAPGNTIKVHMVPFTKMHQHLIRFIPEAYLITIMRRMMYRISERIAEKRTCSVLITGESVGQVASQTLQSMAAINAVVNIPVLRPLVTTDKLDIIALSKNLNCYDISTRPFEDCCTVYVPQKPATAPYDRKASWYETTFDWASIIEELVDQINIIEITHGFDKDLALEGFTMSEVLDNIIK